MQKGNIGVTTENIFPIIKKFLYSDHEIFLRELVSNAVDATQKLNTLASIGEFKGELGDLTIHVELGKDTITISDHGIGLTAEEIEKYILILLNRFPIYLFHILIFLNLIIIIIASTGGSIPAKPRHYKHSGCGPPV